MQAHGHLEYGPRHAEALSDAVRRAAEFADSLQCFFLLHSLGGGTGSGLGTYILGLLEDDFPGVFRFTASVFPSEDDDVITSPYNAALSLRELVDHADCVLPMENQQLADIVERCAARREKAVNPTGSGAAGRGTRGGGASGAALSSSSSSSSSSVAAAAAAGRVGSRAGRQWLHGAGRAFQPRAMGGATGVPRGGALFPDLRPGSSGGGPGGGGGAGGQCGSPAAGSAGRGKRAKDAGEGFDAMNRVGARLLTHITSSMRFPGQLNTDINEITTNLVPFPRLHFLVPALAPLDPSPPSGFAPPGGPSGAGAGMGGGAGAARVPRASAVRALFSDAFSPSHQLVRCDPRRGTYLASALLLRGDLSVSDVNACMGRLQPSLRAIHWNEDGFKVGLCSAAPLEHPHALLALANNTSVRALFEAMHDRFVRLYSRRAMVHHYAGFMGVDEAGGDGSGLFAEAEAALVDLSAAYEELERAQPPSEAELARYVPFC